MHMTREDKIDKLLDDHSNIQKVLNNQKEYKHNVVRHMIIIKFLIELNSRMDGIHIQETTENHLLSGLVKFEASLTCIYANHGMWSPSDAFYQILNETAKKHFDNFKELDDFGFNNTHSVFWIEKDKIHAN